MLRAELHIHSCLSPCADDDMTPANIAGMAMLEGLDVAALTDHNSCGNCPAFFSACEAHGIVPVAGMELTTAEKIHLVCLFPTLETAMAFDAAVRPYRMRRNNRPEIFGNQILMDAQDAVAGEEAELLILATALPLEQAVRLARAHGGAAYPAHIDRESNGILAILGAIPEEPAFETLEVSDPDRADALIKRYRRRVISASDAHHLWNIADAPCSLPLDGGDAQRVRNALIRLLDGGGR